MRLIVIDFDVDLENDSSQGVRYYLCPDLEWINEKCIFIEKNFKLEISYVGKGEKKSIELDIEKAKLNREMFFRYVTYLKKMPVTEFCYRSCCPENNFSVKFADGSLLSFEGVFIDTFIDDFVKDLIWDNLDLYKKNMKECLERDEGRKKERCFLPDIYYEVHDLESPELVTKR